jgi:mevalonate kinase
MEPLLRTSAPGKLILMGEHAVVYGEPGLVFPLPDLRASVSLYKTDSLQLDAPDLNLFLKADALVSSEHPLVLTLKRASAYFTSRAPLPEGLPVLGYQIQSDIPVKRGMGSGTAISCAVFKAFAAYYGQTVSLTEVQRFAQQMDQIYHGQPSGIDAAVIAHERPLRFQRNITEPGREAQITFLEIAALPLLIADTGPARPTAEAVAKVAEAYRRDPAIPRVIQRIGALVTAAEQALLAGDMNTLGALLSENHQCLQSLGISSPALDHLVREAHERVPPGVVAGAKLSGAGLGGVCFALLQQPEVIHREVLSAHWAPVCQGLYG